MLSFINFLSKYADISNEDYEYLSSFIQPKNFPKGSVVLKQGEVENYIYFIEKGISRYYLMDASGKETCILFTFDNWFMGEMSSFLTRQPSLCFIETLIETKTWRIHFDDVQKIYASTKIGDRFGRLVMEQLYLKKAERERSFLTQSAEQRYLDLLSMSPHILQHVHLKHIASYLGVTAQALSRIRKRIS